MEVCFCFSIRYRRSFKMPIRLTERSIVDVGRKVCNTIIWHWTAGSRGAGRNRYSGMLGVVARFSCKRSSARSAGDVRSRLAPHRASPS